jgi:hypothetical protein
VDCQEYVDFYLSADADDELSAHHRQLVAQHLAECRECRARLGEERASKTLIRRHLGIVKAPADVRLRIQAALGELPEHGGVTRGGSARRLTIFSAAGIFSRLGSAQHGQTRSHAAPPQRDHRERTLWQGSVRPWVSSQMLRAQYLAPAALVVILLAASVVAFRVSFRDMSSRPATIYPRSVPVFDFAITSYNHLSQGFAPNVPPEAFAPDSGAYYAWVEQNDPVRHVSDALPDISSSYEKIQMPPEFCDFGMAGYQLVGGRVDRLPGGAPVTYTLYHDGDDSVLSVGLKQRVGAPEGGYWFGTHAFYSYQGYSLCLTIYPIGHFVSIIVTRGPMTKLLRDVATSDIAFLDR